MDYGFLFHSTLTKAGFKLQANYNCFDVGYNPELGWPLKMPDIEAGHHLLLHFQDFVTVKNNRVVELDRLEQHYGKDASRVIVTYWNHGLDKVYSGPVNIVEFSNHNYDLVNVLARRFDEWKYLLDLPKTLAWQCLNGRMCSHRLQVAEILKSWPRGTLSYGDQIPLESWAYSTYRGCENDDNFLRLANVYGSTRVNIVTETIYDYTPGIVSEKTLLAFIAQQIPIVIGHQGIVQHCRELGFDMFDDIVNNSYDSLPNEVRLTQALELNKNFILNHDNFLPYQHRLQANRQYALEKFPLWMEQRFVKDCESLAAKILQPLF